MTHIVVKDCPETYLEGTTTVPRITNKTGAAIAIGALAIGLGSLNANAAVDSGSPNADGQYDLARNEPVQDPIYPQFGFEETDALHYNLDLGWDGRTLTGTTTITVRAAKATNSLRFNLGTELTVSSITVDGRAATADHAMNTLTIATGDLAADTTHSVVISYSGPPKPVAMPSPRGGMLGWNVSRDGSVSTMQEPYGAYTWYPVNDHPSDKAYYDATITTGSNVMGVFNGVLTNKSTDGGNTVTTWHLDKPAASYLTTIAIDPFKVDEQTMSDGKKYTIWYTDQDNRKLQQWRRESKSAYEWLISHVGPNPFASMGMVIVDAGSAMETQTMMTMGRPSMQNGSRGLIGHEMAHQWFGDMVTTKTWRDTWLNEGWTMYFDDEYSGGVNPESSARSCRNSVPQSGQAGNPNPDAFAMMNIYDCPIPAIHEVRKDLGDEAFFKLAAKWPADHAYSSQDRAVFQEWLNRETGTDYTGVFAKWLDNVRSGDPRGARIAHHRHLDRLAQQD